MSKLIANPFTNRKMITKENEFVGREREIGNILPLSGISFPWYL